MATAHPDRMIDEPARALTLRSSSAQLAGDTARKPPATVPLVSEVRAGLGVSREMFARLTGFSVRAIAGWEAGRAVGEPGLRRVREMHRLLHLLAGGMAPEYIPTWLDTPCPALDGLKPVEVLERGEADRLWRVALLIGSGSPV